MRYIRKGKVYTFGFVLDARYGLGNTVEDAENGKYVPLNEVQDKYYAKNPDASIEEVWNAKTRASRIVLKELKEQKIAEAQLYYDSEDVKGFTLNGTKMWLGNDTRTSLVNSVTIEKESGRESTTLWYNGKTFTMACDKMLEILKALEMYSVECFNRLELHKQIINQFKTQEEVKTYDTTIGYPDKLNVIS